MGDGTSGENGSFGFQLDPQELRRTVKRPLLADAVDLNVRFGANPDSGAGSQADTTAAMTAIRYTRNGLIDWLKTRAENLEILIQDFHMVDRRGSVDIGQLQGDYAEVLKSHHVSDVDLNNDGRISRDEFERLWAQDDKEDVDDKSSADGHDGDHDNDEDDKTYDSYDAFGEDRTPDKKDGSK